MEYKFIQKIPLNPPLLKGENMKKNCGQAEWQHTETKG